MLHPQVILDVAIGSQGKNLTSHVTPARKNPPFCQLRIRRLPDTCNWAEGQKRWHEMAGNAMSSWWCRHFFIFTPTIGEDEPILSIFFQMGWFNHQPVVEFSSVDVFFPSLLWEIWDQLASLKLGVFCGNTAILGRGGRHWSWLRGWNRTTTLASIFFFAVKRRFPF